MRSIQRTVFCNLIPMLAHVWILFLGTSAALAQERNVVESGKRASALVEVTAKSTFATAFCIDQDGLFVTNFHVVDNLQPGEPIKLILNANEQNEFALQAKVVHVDQKNDLALLKVQDIPKDRALEALPLASDPKLFETMDVLAFGFPFGVGLSTQQATYPSISVNAGKITAVRKQQGKVILVQLDAVLNPGNSGGPVLNDRGQVIGIVSFGLAKTGVNFAIPVERLSELIRKPSIDAVIPDLTTDLDAPKKVEVTLIPFQEEIPEPTVEFWIKYGDSKSRKFELKPNGKYRFQGSVLVRDSNENSSQALRVNIQLPGSKIRGTITDTPFSIDRKKRWLSTVRSIDIPSEGGQADVQWDDGSSAKINPSKLPKVSVRLDDTLIPVELSKATRIEIEPSATDVQISYILIVKSQGKEIDRQASSFASQIKTQKTSESAASIASATTPSIPNSTGAPVPDVPTGWEKSFKTRPDQAKYKGPAISVPMPGIITQATLAGGGDYLLVTLGHDKKLVVFNIAKAKIEKMLSLTTTAPLVVGTMKHILVIDVDRSVIEKYSLDGFERLLATKLPFGGLVRSASAGYSSQGPLLLDVSEPGSSSDCRLVFFDLMTMKETPFSLAGFETDSTIQKNRHVHLRSSANGKVFSIFGGHEISPGGLWTAIMIGDRFVFKYLHQTAGYSVPSADGMHLLTEYMGVLKPGLRDRPAEINLKTGTIPTSHPKYYIKIPGSEYNHNDLNRDLFKDQIIELREIGYDFPLCHLPQFEMGSSRNSEWKTTDFTIDKRIFVNIEAEAFITIPFTDDTINIQPFNLLEVLKRANPHRIVITSVPPLTFYPGKTFQYQMEVQCQEKDKTFELQMGPEDMQISRTGKISWQVPKATENVLEEIVISVRSGENKQTCDSFTIFNGSPSKK